MSLTTRARELFQNRRLGAQWVLKCRALRRAGKRIIDCGNKHRPGWINAEPANHQTRFSRGEREAREAGWNG
jgi:hypothetical protein